MLLFWTTPGIVFAQLLYLVVIISWAISLLRMILRASDWQIATWKGGNNRLTVKFISQTVHYVRSDVRRGEYFGTELYSMMSPSWELQCEMNFNLEVFTQRWEEEKNSSSLYLIWKVSGKIILRHYKGKSQIRSPSPFLPPQNKLISFSSWDSVSAVFKPGSPTTKLTRYCRAFHCRYLDMAERQ